MRTILAFATSAVLLAGCQTTRPEVFCEVTQPISYSRNDTPETIQQIREHNAVYDELCR